MVTIMVLIKKVKIMKKMLFCLLLIISGIAMTTDIKAVSDNNPTPKCWYHSGDSDCGTGGETVCLICDPIVVLG